MREGRETVEMRGNEVGTRMVTMKVENRISVTWIPLEMRRLGRVRREARTEVMRCREEEKEDLILDMLGLRYSGYQRSV